MKGKRRVTSQSRDLEETIFLIKETTGIIILLYYTENATLTQSLNGACPTAQRLALSVLELNETFC